MPRRHERSDRGERERSDRGERERSDRGERERSDRGERERSDRGEEFSRRNLYSRNRSPVRESRQESPDSRTDRITREMQRRIDSRTDRITREMQRRIDRTIRDYQGLEVQPGYGSAMDRIRRVGRESPGSRTDRITRDTQESIDRTIQEFQGLGVQPGRQDIQAFEQPQSPQNRSELSDRGFGALPERPRKALEEVIETEEWKHKDVQDEFKALMKETPGSPQWNMKSADVLYEYREKIDESNVKREEEDKTKLHVTEYVDAVWDALKPEGSFYLQRASDIRQNQQRNLADLADRLRILQN
jgi:hypothetical protein